MRSERRKTVKRDQPSEEESPEDVRQRNRREAEMLASNLGEGGVSANEILSDMSLLKELAQLQESMVSYFQKPVFLLQLKNVCKMTLEIFISCIET